MESRFTQRLTGQFKKIWRPFFLSLVLGLFFNPSAFSLQDQALIQGQESRLPPLSLIGVVVSQDASSSIATLKNEQSGEILTLRTGENILGFTLSQVFKNSVILKRGDQTYRVFLGRGRISKTTELPQKRPMETPPSAPEKKPAEEQRPGNDVIHMEFNREEVERRLEEELPLIMKDARFIPNLEDGVVRGFKITRLPAQTILSEVGIRRNDIILKINDVELNSVEGMLDLFMKFRNETQFEVSIQRGGKIFRIQYTLK
jgi:type II secretion system protein C